MLNNINASKLNITKQEGHIPFTSNYLQFKGMIYLSYLSHSNCCKGRFIFVTVCNLNYHSLLRPFTLFSKRSFDMHYVLNTCNHTMIPQASFIIEVHINEEDNFKWILYKTVLWYILYVLVILCTTVVSSPRNCNTKLK